MEYADSKELETKSSKVFTVRTGEPSDATQILTFARAVSAEDIYSLITLDEFTFTDEQEIAWLQQMKEKPGSLVIVAELEGEIVGMLDFTSGHRKRIAHTGDFGMSVGKAYREDGIGRAMLESLIAWVSAHPTLEKINLKVHSTNSRAISLYQKLGFIEEGRQLRDLKYKQDQYVDTVLMAMQVKP